MKQILVTLTLATLCVAETFAAPLGTGFTYQGRLNDGGQPANNVYDLTFTLHDDPVNAATIGTYIILSAVPVTNGLFTAELNANGEFGTNAFNGQARWLQIGVRTNSNNAFNNFTFLSPRQALEATPQAHFALKANFASNVADGSITSSKLAPDAVSWANLTGLPAGFADGVDSGETYTAGSGLTLSGANEFSVNFAGAGSANTSARSDHEHFGAAWGGNTSFGQGLSVTNGAGNGAGLYGQQGTGSGFPYLFGNPAGVWGESSQGSGVWGASATSAGVRGISLGTNGYGLYGGAVRTNGTSYGVYGKSASRTGIGVYGLGGENATNPTKDYVGTLSFGLVGESADGAGAIGISDSSVGVLGSSVDGVGVSGTSAHYAGVLGQSTSSSGIGVIGQSTSGSGIGVNAVNNSGVALKASGTGIIQSDADSVLWFPAAGITADYTDSAFRVFPNNVYVQITANEVRTVSVELPLNLPSLLYGQPVTVKTVEVFYKCSNGARSPVSSAVLYRVQTDGAFAIVDSLSGLATSNVPASITLTPNLTLSATSGFLLLHLAAAVNNTADSVYFYGARVVLGHH